MNALDARKAIHSTLGVTPLDGVIGPQTLDSLHRLINAPDGSSWPAQSIQGQGWPFAMHVDGDDLVSDPDIVITCFGGNGDGTNSDPQDDGSTASGINTNHIFALGVSVAMDGRSFSGLSAAEHAALDCAPIPKIPFRTPVIVTIGGRDYGPWPIIDLGPGKEASKPGAAHVCDLSVAAALAVNPAMSLHAASSSFEARGQIRIIGGAKYLSPA